ncbi:hypothetical protein [Aquimarina brevivitae]|uniref:Uncharacterized protein n=1 Tax=Aquimarina brevivitae TaxID=323412 RepID=A0A4Q7PHF2_9FLAO|nr:hypothetical protein [Aquimarina brevivitae]RZS99835.1 hypothetical protein EV197_1063 [Aquimarina brevivitae]
MDIKQTIVQPNGSVRKTEDAKKVKKEIDYWKKQRNKRKCREFEEMSYWEVMCTNTAL